jgi:AraC-like DNA-binding protein
VPPEARYVEWAPRHSPADRVACVWVSRPSQVAVGRVLPDACLDIIWDGSRLFVAGPDTGPVPVEPGEAAAYAGVRFQPGNAPGFLGVPASELLDGRYALSDLWGRAAADWLAERLAAAPNPEAAADVLDAEVGRRAPAAREPDLIIDALVSWLRSSPDSFAAVRVASETLSVGERRLHRRCCTAVGYGPKILDRVLRFQRALRLAPRHRSLAALAADSGYADQAHLARECRRLAGATPSDLFKTVPSPAA